MKSSSGNAAVYLLLLLTAILVLYSLAQCGRPSVARIATKPEEQPVGHDSGAASSLLFGAESTAHDAPLQREKLVPSVTLALETDEGAAILGAKVAVFAAPDKLLHSDTTDASGRCEIEASFIGEQVLIAHDGIAPILLPVPNRSHWQVRVPSFPAVGGRITVNSQSPGRELSLLLRSSTRLLPMDQISDAILACVGLQQHATGNIKATTQNDGSFRISGLPAGWSGAISCQNYELRSEGQSINSLVPVWHELPAPCDDLVINLLEPPKFTGRILNQVDLSPVSKGFIIIYAQTRTRELLCHATLQEGGEFAAYARLWDGEQVLNIRAIVMPEGIAPVKFEQLVADTAYNLGNIVLPLPRQYRIRVISPTGDPVCGAIARVSGADIGCEASGKDGIMVISAASEETVLEVEAGGYLPRRESIAQTLNNDASMTLTPAASLLVTFKNAWGAPCPGARLLILTSREWLCLEDWEGRGRRRVSNGSLEKYSENELQIALTLVASKDGIVTVNGIDPHVQFELFAAPAGGDYCYHEIITDPSASGDHSREILIDASSSRYRGRVLDPAGMGYQPKSITLSLPGDPFPLILAQPIADESGVFETDLNCAEGITIDIISDKYADFRECGITFTTTGPGLSFQLREGRALSVWLEDEYGAPLDGILQASLPSGRSLFPSVKEGGRYIFSNLPSEALTIFALVGLVSYRFDVPPHQVELRAILPPHGTVCLQLPDVLELGDPPTIAAIIIAQTDGTATRQMLRSRRAILGPLLPGSYRVELQEASGFSFIPLGWGTDITVMPSAEVKAELSHE